MTVRRGRGDGTGETGVKSFRCPDDEWAAAKAVARYRGEVLSEVLRAEVNRYANQKERDLMSAHGYVAGEFDDLADSTEFKIKIIGDKGETKWLILPADAVAPIRAIVRESRVRAGIDLPA